MGSQRRILEKLKHCTTVAAKISQSGAGSGSHNSNPARPTQLRTSPADMRLVEGSNTAHRIFMIFLHIGTKTSKVQYILLVALFSFTLNAAMTASSSSGSQGSWLHQFGNCKEARRWPGEQTLSASGPVNSTSRQSFKSSCFNP